VYAKALSAVHRPRRRAGDARVATGHRPGGAGRPPREV